MKKDDTLILGNGFIANRIKEENGWKICTDRINSYLDLEKIAKQYKPKVIICAIGFNGVPNVDNCEENIDKTINANVVIPIYLAELSFRFPDIHIVSILSGCIFGNTDKKYYDEDAGDYDKLFYSRSKIYAEEILKYPVKQNKKISIARIRIPLDYKQSQKNILDKLLKYKTIIDLPNSITYIPTLCKALDFIIQHKMYGVINVLNEGTLRYPKLLDEYKKYADDFNYKIVDMKKLGIERTNLTLIPRRLKKAGFKNENINDIIPICVKKYIENRK